MGPFARADGDFREFFFTHDWPSRVRLFDPDLAKELFCACCVREPDFENGYESEGRCGFAKDFGLALFPATHLHPGINGFFDAGFEIGLDLVVTLVDFAVSIWLGRSGAPDAGVSIEWRGQTRFYRGDANVYHWASGAAVSSYALQSLLLTLERRLLETTEDELLKERATQTLQRAGNLSILSVLISVAKDRQTLLTELLAPVLFSEAIDGLDIQSYMSNSWRLMSGNFAPTDWWRNEHEARRFANLPHRRILLRYFAPWYLLNGDKEVARSGRERWLRLAEERKSSNPRESEVLKLLASCYDRDRLVVGEFQGRRNAVWVELPDDVERASAAATHDALSASRPIMLAYTASSILKNGQLDDAEALIHDLEAAREATEQMALWSGEVNAWVVFLRRAEAGKPTAMGDVATCRSRIWHLMVDRSNSDVEAPEFDDPSHWTTIVADHAPSVFPPGVCDPESRAGLAAFVRCSTGPAIHRFVARSMPNDPHTSVTLLLIARAWAVESVRLQQLASISRNRLDLIPSALDHIFEDRVVSFVESGKWPDIEGQYLVQTDAQSAVAEKWRPSAYENIVCGLTELLERTRDPEIIEGLWPLLLDVLQANSWRSSKESPDPRPASVWDVLGASLPNLPESCQDLVISTVAEQITGGRDAAIGAITALLRSFSLGATTEDRASSCFLSIAEAVENHVRALPRKFCFSCFGCDPIRPVDWSRERGGAWITRHRTFYERTLTTAFSSPQCGPLLVRLGRPEFRQLDSAILDGLLASPDLVPRLRESDLESLAELVLALSGLVRNDVRLREGWRRLVAELEKRGNRLAWQILAEAADRA